MRLYLASCAFLSEESPAVVGFKCLAASDRIGVHSLATDADDADGILFVDCHLSDDWRLRKVTKHELFRQHAGKVLLYDERDEPYPVLPGLYASMPSCHFDFGTQRATAYYMLSPHTQAEDVNPDLLWSFVGSPGHCTSSGYNVRRRILRLNCPSSFVRDTSGFVFFDTRGDPAAHQQQQVWFAQIIKRSKFVLCPRGRGTSSIRLYEVLRAGRVPVILSDAWVAPRGPAWDAFSLWIPERNVQDIPGCLEAAEPRWEQMAAAARRAFDEWFAPDVAFHHIAEKCQELLPMAASGRRPPVRKRYLALLYRDIRRNVRAALGKCLKGRN